MLGILDEEKTAIKTKFMQLKSDKSMFLPFFNAIYLVNPNI